MRTKTIKERLQRLIKKGATTMAALTLTGTMGLMGSCSADSPYSSLHSFLVIDNSQHQNPTLAQLLVPSSGLFATITITQKAGGQFFHLKTNQGVETDIPFNAYDSRRTFVLGQNGALIVGYGIATEGIFYAYDRECPNCFSPEAIPLRSRPITVNENGMGTCNVCHRTYDLKVGGVVATGDPGKPLTRYNANASSTMLSVH